MSIDALRTKLRQPYPQHGIEWRVVVAVASILVIGLVASLWLSDWEHFGRSGSLIVVVGIYITWKDISGKVDSAKHSLHLIIEKEKSKLGSTQGGLLTAARTLKIEEELDATGEQLAGLLEDAKYRVKTLEAITIGLGTVVWGFGGLIGKMFT